MNYIAPSGTPIPFSILARWFLHIFQNRDSLEEFAIKVKSFTGINNCLFISSGRTALYLLLKGLFELRNDPQKNQVIIPAYTCFSVPGSVVKAGLQIRVCDVDPVTLNYDMSKLKNFDFSKVLAVVSANLYGIPNDMIELETITRAHGVYLVDDAAQSLGGYVGDRPSGTYGDAGIYSLDKGKNITSIQGGLIISNSGEINAKMAEIIQALPAQSSGGVLADMIKLLIYAALLPPQFYWLITKLPFTKLGLTPYTTDYPVHQYSAKLASVATLLFEDLSKINSMRLHNALSLQSKLRDLEEIKFIQYGKHIKPVFLRLPVLLREPTKRVNLITHLNANGIGATISYPSAVTDIKEIQPLLLEDDKNTEGGRQVASSIVTLPTQPYVTASHITKISDLIHEILV